MILRPYQREGVDKLLEDLPHHRTLGLIAPTGAGKTVMMLEVAENYLSALGTGFNVIIVSHLSVLQSQTLNGFVKHCRYKASRLQGKDVPHALSKIVITTMQTLRNDKAEHHIHRRMIHNKVSLIMIDEAQMYGAVSYKDIEDKYPEAKIIGFSASPYRGNKYSFNLFDKVSYAISLQELIDQGYLVPPRLHQIDLAGMSVIERISHIAGIIGASRPENSKSTLDRGSLVYWNTKDYAKLASDTFNSLGIKSAYLTDKTTKARRDRVLQGFEDGTYKVIHNVNILSAGYDSSKVFNIFLPMGTSSPVNYIQRIGRGLRLHPEKKWCDVYCYGDAPTIKRGLYQRIHRMSLKVKDDPDMGKQSDIYDQLEWLELQETVRPEKIRYTRELIAACNHMKSLGADNLARLIRFKKFPKRYLRSLMTAQARLDQSLKGQTTESQTKWLVAKGITEKAASTLTRAEADTLISMIQSNLNKKWVINDGLHTNKHISEIPGAYLGALVKKKQFNHPVLKMYTQWKKEGKPQ